jgi:hypothetical protein
MQSNFNIQTNVISITHLETSKIEISQPPTPKQANVKIVERINWNEKRK